MKPKFVILEYGAAEGATNPFGYDPWALFPAWPREPLSDEDYWYNRKVPLPISSSRHMAEILGVIKKYMKFDFEIVTVQRENAPKYLEMYGDEVFVISGSAGDFINDGFLAAYKDKIYMCISAGNEDIEGEGSGSAKPYWTPIGAVTPTLQPADYSSWGKGLVQFVGIAGEEITYDYFGRRTAFIQGTSYACPQHATQIMNLMMAYFEKNGTKPPMKWVLGTRNKHVVDLMEPGKDLKTGYGIYTWDATQYIPTEAEVLIGSTVIRVGTKLVNLPVAPVLIAGSTMVPLRVLSEALGAEVTFIASDKPIIIKR